MKAKVTELLRNDGANVTGPWVEMPPWRESGRGMAVAALDGDGTGAATVTIEGSHDGVHGVAIGAGLALTDAASTKSLAIDYPWPFLRAVVSGNAATTTALRVSVAQ
jgi:hypothetical protein